MNIPQSSTPESIVPAAITCQIYGSGSVKKTKGIKVLFTLSPLFIRISSFCPLYLDMRSLYFYLMIHFSQRSKIR
jgi:hypothetical protein